LLARALTVELFASEAKVALERLSALNLAKISSLARKKLLFGLQSGTAPLADLYQSADFMAHSAAPSFHRPSRGATDSTILSIAESVKRGQCVLFLGAGVHAPPPSDISQVYPEKQRPPFGNEIAKRLAELSAFEVRNPGSLLYDFRRVVQHFEATPGLGRKAL